MGNKSRTGMKASEEEKIKRANSLRGRKLSPEHIQSLRMGSHNRHHVKKGIKNSECKLCQGIQ